MRKLPILAALGHALRSVWHNLPFAWHVSWPWLVLLVPASFVAESQSPMPDMESEDPALLAQHGSALLVMLLMGLLTMLAFSSIAVNWHRYILRDEVPTGWDRLRLDAIAWRYFGNTLLIILVVMMSVLPVAILASLLVAMSGLPAGAAGTLVLVISMLIAIPLTYRLFVKLPAIAMENDAITLKEALRLTMGNALQLCLCGFIIFCGAMLVGTTVGAVLSVTVGDSQGVGFFINATVQQLLGWIVTIFSVTFLTSLYGFFVEGRDF